MTVGYEVKKERGFLHVVADSTINKVAVEKFCEEIPKIARESGISKILVDCLAVTHSLSKAERIEYSINIAEHFKGIKVAVVADTPFRDVELYGETAAQERGAQLRMCTNMAEAFFWLDIKQDQIVSD
jgi:hypothetical protein